MAANHPAANRPWQQIVRQQIGGSKLSRTGFPNKGAAESIF